MSICVTPNHMNLNDYIELAIKGHNLGDLYDATGPNAWADDRTTVREIATAINRNDPHALMAAMRDGFLEHMAEAAKREGFDFENDLEPFEHDAAHASAIIDRENAAYLNGNLSSLL